MSLGQQRFVMYQNFCCNLNRQVLGHGSDPVNSSNQVIYYGWWGPD